MECRLTLLRCDDDEMIRMAVPFELGQIPFLLTFAIVLLLLQSILLSLLR